MKTISSTDRSELVFHAGGRAHPLVIRRSPTARAARLAIDHHHGAVRLSVPARASLARALAWAETKRPWVEAALARIPAPCPIAPGATIPFEGGSLTVDWDELHARKPVREGDRLMIGGPHEGVAARALRWLKAEALERLSEDSRCYATRAGVTIGRIGIGDPRARWGSCSAAGGLRYSWRLILAPVEVRRATAAHEIGHRLHMHHGPAFHAAVETLFGRDPAPERQWLRTHGAMLHAVGRG